MKKVYVFGNEYVKEDSFAHKIAEKLEGVEIVYCRSPEQLLEIEENEIMIMDVVENIKEPMRIEDMSQLTVSTMFSLHGFDLGFFLPLMEKMGMKKNIKIIGLPNEGDIEKISEKVKEWI